MSLALDTPVQYVRKVGPRRAGMLAKASILTVEDLLRYKPFRYEDRTNFKAIRDLTADQEAVITARVEVTGNFTTPMKRMRIFEMRLRDSTGSLSVKFFNQPYLDKVFRKGQQVIVFGVPQVDSYTLELGLLNPEYEILGDDTDAAIHTGRIVPIYRKIGQLYPKSLRQILYYLCEDLEETDVPENLPAALVRKFGFPGRLQALRSIHFPSPVDSADRTEFLNDLEAHRTPAHERMIFEEFFFFQLGLQMLKSRRQLVAKERRIEISDTIREVVKGVLPFHPTGAQKRVLKEIVDDLCSSRVMNRLVQGDVGSGKTIVALQAILVVVENGFQAVLMAPTEILAEQHYQNIVHYLRNTAYNVVFLSGKIKGKKRKEILQQVKSGEAHLIIGTHAVFQKAVHFQDLGLTIIDEQHRFGVLQRSQIIKKGERPDTLVMTATPIPRTLALTLYGDLDLSIIDEMPPGRQPVQTFVKPEKSRPEVYAAVRRELQKGRQVYIVYPLVEESDKVELRAASEMAEHLQQTVFPDYRVGLIHGRLKPEEKETLMADFQRGAVQILVSTTVIEVGIDVANATLMIIEHANRFGLSQLHQLRGRVGRGLAPGYCILMTEGPQSREAFERLSVMRHTTDGFRIAEKDLEIRGPGEFVGTRQSGLPGFLFANLVRDRETLEVARAESGHYVQQLLGAAGEGDSPDDLLQTLVTRWRDRYGLYEVG